MSNANKLRGALMLALQGETKLYNNTDLPNNTAMEILYGKKADLILQAIEAELPGEKEAVELASDEDERGNFHLANSSYLRAITDVKSLLASARSGSNHEA